MEIERWPLLRRLGVLKEGHRIWKTAGGSWFWTYRKTTEYVIIQDACGELSTVCYVCVCVGSSHNNISTYIWYFCALGDLRKGSVHSVSFSRQMFNLWRHCLEIHVNTLSFLSVCDYPQGSLLRKCWLYNLVKHTWSMPSSYLNHCSSGFHRVAGFKEVHAPLGDQHLLSSERWKHVLHKPKCNYTVFFFFCRCYKSIFSLTFLKLCFPYLITQNSALQSGYEAKILICFNCMEDFMFWHMY